MGKNSSAPRPQKLPAAMDRRIDTPAWKPIFPGTSTTILADTQHALILNYADTKPCSAREKPPLSSGATSAIIKPTNLRRGLPPLPRFIDPTSTRPPLERGQEAVSFVSLSFSNLRVSLSLSRASFYPAFSVVPPVPVFFSVALVDPPLG